MKLLFVHQTLGEFGGAEANIRLAASELKARGHSLALAHLHTTGRNEEEWRRIFSTTYCLRHSAEVEQVATALEQFAPDVIYLHNLSDLPVLEALFGAGVPVVRMVHDHSMYCLRGYKYNYFTRKVCARAASPYCVFPCLANVVRNPGGVLPFQFASYPDKRREIELNRQCRAWVVYSTYLKDELVRNGFPPQKISVCVPMKIAGAEGQASSFSNRNLILFAGQIIRGKGVDALLRALSKVRAPFECAVLGDGNHRAYCQRLSRKLGLNGRVTFHGYLPQAELKRFYLETSVFVMSSLWPEPFGMAGPEAMRYGLPVVAFDAGGISEWLKDGENGFLVPWNDLDQFASRLELLLENKELARALGKEARLSVQRFDLPGQVNTLETLFAQLARPTPRKSAPSISQELSVCL
jgi:glycosyltransferase involved in cell wall biosynthesis